MNPNSIRVKVTMIQCLWIIYSDENLRINIFKYQRTYNVLISESDDRSRAFISSLTPKNSTRCLKPRQWKSFADLRNRTHRTFQRSKKKTPQCTFIIYNNRLWSTCNENSKEGVDPDNVIFFSTIKEKKWKLRGKKNINKNSTINEWWLRNVSWITWFHRNFCITSNRIIHMIFAQPGISFY